MPRESFLTVGLAALWRIPFALRRQRPFTPPQKVLILKPCCVSQVMLTTPLLTVLHRAFPKAQFDWAVSDWARPAVMANPHLKELIRTGTGSLNQATWAEIRVLVAQIRAGAYDTCFIPSRSSLLAWIAWQAGIPQRVGLNVNGRGFAHTIAVRPAKAIRHEAERYLLLAQAVGIDAEFITTTARTEFHAPDRERTAVTARLVEEIDWLGDTPLVVIHPGGGQNPAHEDVGILWPPERFVRLGNHLARQHGARVVLVGAAEDLPVATAVMGMMSAPVTNLAGTLSLGELGALCEVADLYVGNDSGPTHIAAATDCPTLVIFGPSDPAVSSPYGRSGQVLTLWRPIPETGFSWETGVNVAEAIQAADTLLRR